MTSVKFVLVNTPTNTARFLTSVIFNKDALAILRTYGLLNVYLDDYGCSKKYTNCLFFLFHVQNTRDFEKFQNRITDFSSFYDYYDIETPDKTMRMYVFKVNNVYRRDLFSFKHSRMDELSDDFLKISDPEVDFTKINVNIVDEIYRFRLHLQTIKEDI